jgi:phage/plasmid-associated DNA primase
MSDAEIRAALDQAEEYMPGDDIGSIRRQHLDIGSDVEIAERVAADFRQEFGEVVFADGDFWRYGGTHWRPIEHVTARRAVHLYDGAIYQTPCAQPVAVKLSKGRIDSVLHEMGAMLARPDFFAEAPTGINCASGFIAFDATGQPSLLPHDRDHRCRHVLPGHWRSAETSAEDPPADSLLGRLLGGVFKGDEDEHDKRKLLAEIAGAAALGHATKLRQPKAVVLKGEKAENGKSQILDLNRGLLPASAIASITAAKFGDERFIVVLRSKLLNATDELSSSAAIASDAFKAVITGEPVSGRAVYRSVITFRPVAQHIFSVNMLPTFAGGMDRGVQRRLLVVTFNRVIPVGERIERIGLRVGEEEPDLLLALAVAGAARLIRQKGFTVPDSSALALRDWLFGADPVLAWTEVRVRERDPARGAYKSGHAHSMFKEWALANGFRDSTIPAVNGFVQRLQANLPSAVVKHTRSGNWLRGFEILLQDQKDDEDATG